MTLLVDSHCHLDRIDLDAWDGGLDAVLTAGRDAGVGHFLCVSVNLDDYPRMREMMAPHDDVSVSVGVHPDHKDAREPDVDELVQLAADPGVVAIGETGLDYFYGEGDLEWQRERFRIHIRAARKAGKPLIVHSRDAKEDTLRLMEEEGAAETGGVLHCFTGDWDMACRAIEQNFMISFSGIVTFRNATELKDIAARLPQQHILVETDAPWLAPVPHRGKPNQPAWVRDVASHVADLRGETLEKLAEYTTANFSRLFSAARL